MVGGCRDLVFKNIVLILAFLFGLSFSFEILAKYGGSGIRVRAREHYEIQKFYVDKDLIGEYRGLTNTLNIWYEAAPVFYFGLALNPIIGSLESEDVKSELLTPLIRHYHAALDLKLNLGFFGFLGFSPGAYKSCFLCSFYLRAGTGQSWIDPGGTKPTLNGTSMLGSLAWHLTFDSVEFAFEYGIRQGIYDTEDQNELSMNAEFVAIGVHFLPGKTLY